MQSEETLFQKPREIESSDCGNHHAVTAPTVVPLNEERFLTHSHGPLHIWEIPGVNRELKEPIEVGLHSLSGKVTYEHTFGMKKGSESRVLSPWEVSVHPRRSVAVGLRHVRLRKYPHS